MKTWIVILAAMAAHAQSVPEPLTLRQALEIAEKASPDVQRARLVALEQAAQALVARAPLGPQVSIEAGVSRRTNNLAGIGVVLPGQGARIGPYNVFDARPVVRQTVLDLSLLDTYRAAKHRTKQSEEEIETIAEETRIAVVQLYLQALQADSRARAAAARVETANAVLRQTQDAEQAGTANKLDLRRAEQQVERERTAEINAKRDRDVVSVTLLKTIGVAAERPVELAPFADTVADPSGDAPTFTKQALGTRPEVKALDAKRGVLADERRSAERERYPKVQAFADYGVLGQTPAQNVSTWSAGATVSIPVYTSGRIENGIKAAKLREQQWQEERRALELRIAQEVTQSLVERNAGVQASEASKRAADAARDALELARLRYGAGLTTNLDVITAQGELAQAEEDAIRARYDALLAQANLARARGNVRLFVEGQ